MQTDTLRIGIRNETDRLLSVVLGTAEASGPPPSYDEAYDPTSRQHILAGQYPREEDMCRELSGFEAVLKKHGVEVYRPDLIAGCNQIFVRDIAFVVGQKLFRSNILPQREEELRGIDSLLRLLPEGCVVELPPMAHAEGGDVMPWNEFLFVGVYQGPDYSRQVTARTNDSALRFLQEYFPERRVVGIDLVKSNTRPEANALHLDCCFQPVGRDLAILCPQGLRKPGDGDFLRSLFPPGHVFEVTAAEMAGMYCNVFSISPEVVVTEAGFDRLNHWLRERGLQVEPIPFSEISKQGGLLRCTTLPLLREG